MDNKIIPDFLETHTLCQFSEVWQIFNYQAAAVESSRDERCERGPGEKEAAAAVQEFSIVSFTRASRA